MPVWHIKDTNAVFYKMRLKAVRQHSPVMHRKEWETVLQCSDHKNLAQRHYKRVALHHYTLAILLCMYSCKIHSISGQIWARG